MSHHILTFLIRLPAITMLGCLNLSCAILLPAHKSFYVNTTGLSIFTGKMPVLYIPIIRSAELTLVHQELYHLSTAKAGSGIQEYYHPDAWMPHITIGFGDLDSDILARMIHYLGERDFNWRILIDNIIFIYDPGTGQEVKYRFQLTA